MFKNYLKIALRNLIKSKGYSLINITGLAIGLAGFILISIYIQNELNFEDFQENRDLIYRPVEIQTVAGVGTQHVAVTMGPLAKALKNDFPEISHAGRLMPMGQLFCEFGNNRFWENSSAFCDPDILDIFTMPFVKGDPKTALNNPNSLVIDEQLAEKYFGSENPLGKILTINHRFGREELIVTGVMKKYPENSHLNLTMLVSFSGVEEELHFLKSWGNNTLATYILVQPGTDIEALEEKLPDFKKRNIQDDSWLDNMEFYLQPLKEVHLYSKHIVYQTYRNNEGNINNVVTFSIISLFILLIACFNFMNLSTARSSKRAREVGMRKVLGSTRKNLIYQFLGESVIISLIALVIAVLVVEIAFPYFKNLFTHPITNNYFDSWQMIAQLIAITVLVGVFAGSYPAFFLSSFKPVDTLKGSYSGSSGGALLRKVLVVAQFAIAVILVINTGIVWDQLNFINNKDKGYNTEHAITFPVRTNLARQKINLLKTELLKNPDIKAVAATSGLTGASGSQGTMTVAGTNGQKKSMIRYSYVDYDYINTMEMRIVQGRMFSEDRATDSTNAVIINETAVQEFGWENPIGKQFEKDDEGGVYTVIGVVNDYHFYSLHHKIEPLMMFIRPSEFFHVVARVNPQNFQKTIEFAEQTWQKIIPKIPFEYHFLDEKLAWVYDQDKKLSELFTAFSLLAIFVACLGLFGLVSFSTEQKTKEIGIRKVLGASVGGIILLLSKEFARWVVIAGLIAFPLAYFSIQHWLNQFEYRTELHLYLFVLAALLVFIIAWITISFQAIKAAVSNPVEALHYE